VTIFYFGNDIPKCYLLRKKLCHRWNLLPISCLAIRCSLRFTHEMSVLRLEIIREQMAELSSFDAAEFCTLSYLFLCSVHGKSTESARIEKVPSIETTRLWGWSPIGAWGGERRTMSIRD
jgi:hypothetical protein